MISTVSAKPVSHFGRLGIPGRFRIPSPSRSLAGSESPIDGGRRNSKGMSSGSAYRPLHYLSGDRRGCCSDFINRVIKFQRYKNASSICPIIVPKNAGRSYSSSTKKDNNGGKSGQDQHAFFQEQMLELQREQRQFGQVNDESKNDEESDIPASSDVSPSSALSAAELEDQLNDWKSEQAEVFGESLADYDDGWPTTPNITSNNSDNSVDSGLESEERESRFEFTSEDLAAWGKPNPDPGDMQRILEEVALEREKEAAYAKSASLSPPSSKERKQQQAQIHHESFSHVSEDGSGVHMVDVGHKALTTRTAHARSEVWLPQDVLDAFLPSINSAIEDSSGELVGPKGPIFATAKIAGIMACKKTSDLIPLCHPLPLDQVQIDIRLKDNVDNDSKSGGTVVIDCTCKVTHKTGVEMEALTGATVAALTIYDMTKAVSHNIRIRETKLMGKTGGKRTVLDGVEHQN